MRCKNCDYTLWNIRARECPECGTPFKPSDFTFTLNAVRYCCPHCQQDYYGTGPQGELVPRSFTCVSCAHPIDMDEMVLLPTEGVSEEITQPDIMPWLERHKIGFFRGFFGTILRSMGSPGRLIKMVPEDHPPTHGFIFAALTSLLYLALGLSPLLLIMLIPLLGVGGRGGLGGAAASAGGTAGTILGGVVFTLVLIVVWGLSAHLVLAATGPTLRGPGRTYHALCYSSGANVLVAIPCFGPYLFWIFCIWWVVSAIIMLKDAQGVSAGRAVAALLALPLLLLMLAGFAVIGVVAYNGGFSGGSTWTPPPPPPPAVVPGPATIDPGADPGTDPSSGLARAGLVAGAVVEVRKADPNAHPALLLEYPVSEALLPGDGPLAAGSSGKAIDEMDEAQTVAIIATLTARFPTPSVMRLGDFVFVYPGLPPDEQGNTPDNAWTCILAPEGEELPDTMFVGLANGAVLTLTRADFLDQLDAENVRRAGWGIPTIPYPSRVSP